MKLNMALHSQTVEKEKILKTPRDKKTLHIVEQY